MKILWFSNRGIIDSNISGSGSWLYSMSQNLTYIQDVEIVNITEATNIHRITEAKSGNIHEWTLPKTKLNDGLPSQKIIDDIVKIVDSCQPDLIHIWGVENYWGLLFSRGYIKHKYVLLEIQGLLFACNDYYRNSLYWHEHISVQPLPNAIYSFVYIYLQSIKFSRRLKFEKEILRYFQHISYQSSWTCQKLELVSKAKLYYSLRPIRPQFLESPKWSLHNSSASVLTIASAEPYKGLHITLKAFALVLRNFPDITLCIAGVNIKDLRRGYIKYIFDLVGNLGIEKNVTFVGSLAANQLIETMRISRCMVISSYVESYSAVFAEAMCIGIPTVVSFSGAMSEFAINNESALYYTPGDYYQCAHKICKLLSCDNLAETISVNSIKLSKKNDAIKVAQNQMDIYHKVLERLSE